MTDGFVLRVLLITGLGVICVQLIRGKTPAMATALSMAAILSLLWLLLPKLQALWQIFQELLSKSGLDLTLFLPVIKVLAITVATHISAELCRDAGERALAAKLELCGAAASLLCVLPLAEQALSLIGALGQ